MCTIIVVTKVSTLCASVCTTRAAGVWGVVCNAGVLGDSCPDDWLTSEDYRRVLDVNVLGVVRCTHAFLPFVKRQRGRIVLMGSMVGKFAMPGTGPYVVSKFALEGYADVIRYG